MIVEELVSRALEKIDYSWGSAKRDLVSCIATETSRAPGYRVPMGYRALARWTGVSPRYTWRALRELVEECVLFHVERAVGSRGNCYEIVADPAQWRVPWRQPREQVLVELAWTLAALEGPDPRLVPRYSAARVDLVPRWGAARAPRWSAAQSAAPRHLVPRSSAALNPVDNAMPSSLLRVTPSLTPDGVTDGVLQRIANEIGELAGGAVFGRYLDQLRAGLDPGCCDAASVIDALRRRGHGLRLDGLIALAIQASCSPALDELVEVPSRIECADCAGSGFIVDDDGLAWPCAHPSVRDTERAACENRAVVSGNGAQ